MGLKAELSVTRAPAHALWMAAAVLALDYVTPPTVQVSSLFVVPAAYAAWYGGRRWGFLIAALPLLRLVTLQLKPPPWSLTVSLVNLSVRIAVLCLVVYLVDRVAMQRRRLRILEGMLPICSYCRRIRTEADDWQQLERYISTHSEATFSHGICPTCAKEHFGEVSSSGSQ